MVHPAMACFLPTPPGTSHREKDRSKDKENIGPKPHKRRRVVEWSDDTDVYLFSSSPIRSTDSELNSTKRNGKASSSSRGPIKGILKPAKATQPLPQEMQREVTPQPDNLLGNSQYLEWPISTLLKVDEDVKVKDLIEAWSVLTARLRSGIDRLQNEQDDKKQASDYPLLHPLRQNIDKLTKAVVRDLGRVFVNPLEGASSSCAEVKIKVEEEEVDLQKISGLMSPPKDSPKKAGMSAEQVKYSRDLCVVCHSVIKFLLLAFTAPMIYNIFTHDQIHDILTIHLSILLEPSLPTANSRKTYAMAMSLIQLQKLPSECLTKEVSRITLAIRRGLEGQLGREGKKGPGSDGLRAVHDLSINHPTLFIPTLANIIPSVLSNLSSTSAAIRIAATHALGGFAYAFISSEELFSEDQFVEIQACASKIMYDYVIGPKASSSTPTSPTKNADSDNETWIVKTLKTVVNISDPPSNASSPVWGVCILSSIVVLLGPVLLRDFKALRLISSLLQPLLKHKKGSVRALAYRIMSMLTLGWIKYGKDGVENQDDLIASTESKQAKNCREMYWRVICASLDGGNAVALLGALLGPNSASCSAGRLKRVSWLMNTLTTRGGMVSKVGMEALRHLVTFDSEYSEDDYSSFLSKLLPPSHFSVSPGLLTADWALMTQVTKNAIADLPAVSDVRPLTASEASISWVWSALLKSWKDGLTMLLIGDEEDTPHLVMDIWQSLVKVRANSLDGNDDEVATFARECATILIDIIKDDGIDFRISPGNVTNSVAAPDRVRAAKTTSNSSTQVSQSKYSIKARKISIVRDLWSAITSTFSSEGCYPPIGELLSFLVLNEKSLVPSENIRPQGNTPNSVACVEWARLAAVIVKSGVNVADDIVTFWNGPSISGTSDYCDWDWPDHQRSLVWRAFSRTWRDEDGAWEGSFPILGLPFNDPHPWNMNDTDVAEWEAMLQYCVVKGLDCGQSSFYILELIAKGVEKSHFQMLSPAIRIADLLLSQLDFTDVNVATEYPETLIDIIHDILDSSYPPEPRNKLISFWLIRSVMNFIDNCDPSWLVDVLCCMQRGLCAWMTDECNVLSTHDYSVEIVPLYQTILVALHSSNPDTPIVKRLSSIFVAPFNARSSPKAEIASSFQEFWENSCTEISEPKDGWPEELSLVLDQMEVIIPERLSQRLDERSSSDNSMDVDEGYDADVSLSSDKTQVDEIESEDEDCSDDEVTLVSPKIERVPEDGFKTRNIRPSVSAIFSQPKSTNAKPCITFSAPTPLYSLEYENVSLQGRFTPPSTPLSSAKPTITFEQAQPSSSKRKRSMQDSSPRRRLSCSSNCIDQDEKENITPLPLFIKSPSAQRENINTKKRCYSSNSSSDDSPVKKLRFAKDIVRLPSNTPEDSVSDSDDIRMVEECLLVEKSKSPTSPVEVSRNSRKIDLGICSEKLPSLLGHLIRQPTLKAPDSKVKSKRRRVFMDAVEVPTLQQLEKAYTRSRRGSACGLRDLHSSVEFSSSDDSLSSGNDTLIESDDSFFRPSGGCTRSALANSSSDDDSALNSITTQHILTPPLRRVMQPLCELNSDDSIPSSPSSRVAHSQKSSRVTAVTNKALTTSTFFVQGYEFPFPV